MIRKPQYINQLYIPIIGLLLFFVLYFVATIYYPGGNQVNMQQPGFSWKHNYWCNLLNEQAINGQLNTARWWAMAAAVTLIISLIHFWFLFAQLLIRQPSARLLMQACALGCLITALFTFTRFHDAVVNVAGALGLALCALTLWTLLKYRWNILLIWGFFAVVLIAANNFLYYSGRLEYLPMVQKISFVCILLWVVGISLRIMQWTHTENESV